MKPSLINFLKTHKEELDRPKPDYSSLFDSIYENLNNEDTVELIFRLTTLRPHDKIEFYRLAKLNEAVHTAFSLWDSASRFPDYYEVPEFIDFWIKNDLGYPKEIITEVIKDIYKDWSNKFSYAKLPTGEYVIRRYN